MTTNTNTQVLPAVYAIHLRSDWAGLDSVDSIQAVATSREVAERIEAESEWPTEGRYGRLFTAIVEHKPSKALQTLASKGASFEGTPNRVWVGDHCVAASHVDCHYYNISGPVCRPLTRAEHRYIEAYCML